MKEEHRRSAAAADRRGGARARDGACARSIWRSSCRSAVRRCARRSSRSSARASSSSRRAARSVVALDARDAREIMDLREMIDGLAARLLAERGMSAQTDRELTALAHVRCRPMAPRDKHRYLVANGDFHVKIVEATGHERLRQFVPLVRMSARSRLHAPARPRPPPGALGRRARDDARRDPRARRRGRRTAGARARPQRRRQALAPRGR